MALRSLLSRPFDARRTTLLQWVVLAVILLVAAVFRVHGLQTWDGDTHQHPDERFLTIVGSSVKVPSSLANYFDTQHSTINPYVNGQDRYAYGQLPLTLTRIVAEWTGLTSYETVYKVGRDLSAL